MSGLGGPGLSTAVGLACVAGGEGWDTMGRGALQSGHTTLGNACFCWEVPSVVAGGWGVCRPQTQLPSFQGERQASPCAAHVAEQGRRDFWGGCLHLPSRKWGCCRSQTFRVCMFLPPAGAASGGWRGRSRAPDPLRPLCLLDLGRSSLPWLAGAHEAQWLLSLQPPGALAPFHPARQAVSQSGLQPSLPAWLGLGTGGCLDPQSGGQGSGPLFSN